MQIPEDELQCAPLLDLEILDAPLMPNVNYYLKQGEIFNINARGLINNKKARYDGCVFFGGDKIKGMN